MSLCSSSVSITRSGNSDNENKIINQLKIPRPVPELLASGNYVIPLHPPRTPPYEFLSQVLNLVLALAVVFSETKDAYVLFFFSWPIFTETKATSNLIFPIYFSKMNSFQLRRTRKLCLQNSRSFI